MTANFSDSDPQDAVDFDDAILKARVLVAYFNCVEVNKPRDHDGLHIIAQAVLDMKKELDDLASRLETAQSEEMSMAAEMDAATAKLEDAKAQVTVFRTALEAISIWYTKLMRPYHVSDSDERMPIELVDAALSFIPPAVPDTTREGSDDLR